MRRRNRSFAPLLLLSFGVLVATAPGCKKECEGSACTSNATDSGTGGGRDGGSGGGVGAIDSGVKLVCTSDESCASLANGSVCDITTGECLVGRGCNDNTNCQSFDDKDPCYQFGAQCRCDKRDAPDTTTLGTCRRRLAACDVCQTDADCGDDPIIYGPPDGIGYGKCRAMTGDTSGKKFCLYQRVGACKCGTAVDNENLCRPVNNSCTDVGCRNDKNCPTGSVCTASLPDSASGACGGVCKPRCRWNFDTRELVMPGCPSNQTCWVDAKNLDAGSPYYGAGRCQAPCADSAECALTANNPFGGPNLVCKAEKLKGDTLDAKRCRADGACMDDFECPALADTQPALGYCDRGSRTCKSDCREGNDPVTGKAFRDCRAPYACRSGTCTLLNCMEQGGAAIACARGQYCCGEDKNDDGTADPCPPAAELDGAGCYNAARPPFCTPCTDDNGCKDPALPAYLSGACTNGAKNPACSLLPAVCVTAGTPMGAEAKLCAPSTVNDDTLVNGKAKYALGCPVGYTPSVIRPNFTQGGDDLCGSDDDCNKGTTTGKCEADPSIRLADGGSGKACRCDSGSGKAQCPNDMNIATECRNVSVGGRSTCITSIVCVPPFNSAYTPSGSPTYGCGL